MKRPDLVKLEGKKRDTGRKETGKLRNEMRVPSVLYGPKVKENLHFSIDELELEKILSVSQTSIQELTIDGTVYETLLKRVEYDPVSDRPIHADFYVLDPKQPVTLNVPIRLKGTAIGVRDGGGRVFQTMRIIRIKVLPEKIPALFEVDITELEIGDSVHVSDLEMEGITAIDDGSRSIVTIAPPKSEELFTSDLEEDEDELTDEVPAEGEEAVAEGEDGEEEEGDAEKAEGSAQ